MEIYARHFEKIDSTNTWAKVNAHTLDRRKMTIITADEQTDGRGSFRRKWESAPYLNIYASFCFFIEDYCPEIGNVPQVLAISIVQLLKKMGMNPQIKWPNDILLSHKKISGILAETVSVPNGLCLILGVGLNVNISLDLLQKISQPATSILLETGRLHDVKGVLKELQDIFLPNLSALLAKGFHPFLREYKDNMEGLGSKNVRFYDNRTIWEGVLHSVEPNGSLNLLLPNGEKKNFLAGEVLWGA